MEKLVFCWKLDILAWKQQSVAYFIETLVILSKYIIFHEDNSNGTELQWKNWYFVWYFLKTWYFNETHWMRLHYSEKIGIFHQILDITWNCENRQCSVKIYQTGASYLLKKAILLKSVIFQWNTLNGIGFKWKIWYSSVISVKSVNFQ